MEATLKYACLLLLLTADALGVVAPKIGDSVTCYQASATVCEAATALPVVRGDAIVLIALRIAQNEGASDDCGNTYTDVGFPSPGTNVPHLFIALGIPSTLSCKPKVQRTNNGPVSFIAQVYSGVGGYTALSTPGTGWAGNGTVNTGPVNIPPDGLGVGGFLVYGGTDAPTVTFSSSGNWTLRTSTTGQSYNLAMTDNPTVGSINGQVMANPVPPSGTFVARGAIALEPGAALQGHTFYGTPPISAGTGITVTPSPTAITISATGSPAGGSPVKVAGSTYSLASETFNANSCVLRPAGGISAPGTVPTDTVLLTRESTQNGWAQGRLRIQGIPFTGTISIEICNPEQSGTINPGATALPLNWMVLR